MRRSRRFTACLSIITHFDVCGNFTEKLDFCRLIIRKRKGTYTAGSGDEGIEPEPDPDGHTVFSVGSARLAFVALARDVAALSVIRQLDVL